LLRPQACPHSSCSGESDCGRKHHLVCIRCLGSSSPVAHSRLFWKFECWHLGHGLRGQRLNDDQPRSAQDRKTGHTGRQAVFQAGDEFPAGARLRRGGCSMRLTLPNEPSFCEKVCRIPHMLGHGISQANPRWCRPPRPLEHCSARNASPHSFVPVRSSTANPYQQPMKLHAD
jgi:hypothetical protein